MHFSQWPDNAYAFEFFSEMLQAIVLNLSVEYFRMFSGSPDEPGRRIDYA